MYIHTEDRFDVSNLPQKLKVSKILNNPNLIQQLSGLLELYLHIDSRPLKRSDYLNIPEENPGTINV